MPGTHERHQAKAGSGLRNFQHLIFGAVGDDDYFATALTGGPLTSLVVGSKLTLLNKGMPLPRVVTLNVTSDVTAGTRALTMKFHGEDQFGNYVTDSLSTSNIANQTRVALGVVVFARVTVIEVTAISGFFAGDDVKVGLDIHVGGQLAPEDVIYGLPVKVDGADDIRGATLVTGGLVGAAILSSGITLVPGVHGVKLPAGAAPDLGNDRVVIVTGRTSL